MSVWLLITSNRDIYTLYYTIISFKVLYSNTNFNFLYFSVINCEIPATIWCLGCSKCFSHSFIHLLISSMALVLLSSHLSALILQTLSSLHITEDKIIEKDLFSVKFIVSPSSFSHINFPLFHFYLSVCFIVPKIPSFKSLCSFNIVQEQRWNKEEDECHGGEPQKEEWDNTAGRNSLLCFAIYIHPLLVQLPFAFLLCARLIPLSSLRLSLYPFHFWLFFFLSFPFLLIANKDTNAIIIY